MEIINKIKYDEDIPKKLAEFYTETITSNGSIDALTNMFLEANFLTITQTEQLMKEQNIEVSCSKHPMYMEFNNKRVDSSDSEEEIIVSKDHTEINYICTISYIEDDISYKNIKNELQQQLNKFPEILYKPTEEFIKIYIEKSAKKLSDFVPQIYHWLLFKDDVSYYISKLDNIPNYDELDDLDMKSVNLEDIYLELSALNQKFREQSLGFIENNDILMDFFIRNCVRERLSIYTENNSTNILQYWYKEKLYDDITIILPDQSQITAMKCVLATKSAYFHAMLFGETPMKEAINNKIIITDEYIDLPTLSEVIKFMYLGELELENITSMGHLKNIVEQYQIIELQKILNFDE